MQDLSSTPFGRQASHYLMSSVVFAMFSYCLSRDTNFGLDLLCSSINFDDNDKVSLEILGWMAEGNKDFRRLKYPLNDHGTHSSSKCPAQEDQRAVSSIRYEPFLGTFLFWHKGRLFIFRRVRRAVYYETEHIESLSLETLGWSPEPIKRLVEDVRLWGKKKESKTTKIYRPRGKRNEYDIASWKKALSRQVRPIESIILDHELKTRIVEDVRSFLDKQTRKKYAALGIPYRRGYLFHGLPGTGKTSLSIALAGLFGLDIYIIPLSDNQITDSNFKDLFTDLPDQCIVLLEDIDAENVTKQRAALGDGDHQEHARAQGVSYSTLLNTIDGADSPEGQILIMTTNCRHVLDSALIRPGRVDLEFRFNQATSAHIEQLYHRVYPAEEQKPGRFSNIPDNTLSMAEVQSVFLEHMEDASAAANALAAFAQKREEI
jgi:chaperone BCS1